MSRLSPATVELLDFVEEGQAEALLAMDARERGLAHAYPSIEKVANNCREIGDGIECSPIANSVRLLVDGNT